MDVFKQFLDKNTAKPELKVGAGKDGGSSSQFLDKLIKMKFSREKLGIITLLAVSSGVFFLVWHHPKLRYRRPAEPSRRRCKTRGCQTNSDELTCTTISVSGCPAPAICVSAPPTAEWTPCCAGECGETATVVDMEDSGHTVVVHPSQRPRAILGTWTTRSRGPPDFVSISHDGGNGRRKRVSFSENVVEPVGDNEAYRRNARSATARQGAHARRLDNSNNGDVSHKDAANRTIYAGAPRPPSHPDTIRNAMQQEPQPTANENGVDVVKGCRHTRSADTAEQRLYPLKQHDRNMYDRNSQYCPSPGGANRTPSGQRIIPKNSICDQSQNCCKITGSLTCTSTPTQSDIC